MTSLSPINQAASAGSTSPTTASKLAQPERTSAENQQQVRQIADQMSQSLQGSGLSVGLKVDSDRDSLVILVTDGESGELIRQIPSEEALARADRLDELRSILFDSKA